jgi:TolB-like protein/class 3 adenylate cyclase/Tfp pilus assembly protein PilF
MIGNQASGKIDNRLPARVLPEQIRRRFALDGVASRLRLSTSRNACVRTQMSTEVKSNLQLEIGHVLFIDVVGYSKRLIDDQRELQQQLNEIVRGTEQFHAAEAAGKLVRLPTGDGMALVFFTSPESPVQCALEISEALQSHPQLRVRMGINSGPVSGVADVNDRSNVAGTGINMAQRLMDIGDAGHILLSRRAAEDLVQYRHWEPHLHNLGEFEVKHGVKISVVNLYTEKLGNPQIPEKLRQFSRKLAATRRLKRTLIAALLFLAVALPAGALIILRRTPVKLTSSRATLIPEKSIAVLPFENLSANQENAFFTDGVQDEILTYLSKIADLKVISRTSVMQYKSTATRNLREIAQQLGVAHVLEGSVQRAANRIRVNAQLVDARSDTHLWAEHYDRDLADVFAIQSEIAEAIAGQLQAKISPGEKAAISQAPTTDLTANALYVQGKELEFKAPEKESLLQAVHLLEEAVARDPHFILAYCMLGRLHLKLYWGGYDHTSARRELANMAIQNAVRLQPDAGEVHLALAWYAYQGFRDYDRARAELDLAGRTLPNNADIYYVTALIDRRQGRWAEATRNLERAVELDPRNFGILLETADTYRGLRQYSDAIRLSERALAVSPRDYFARILRASLPFFERADIGSLRTELSAILTEEPGAAGKIADVMFRCAMAERDSAAADRAVTAIPPEGISPGGNFIFPREWFVGVAARTFNDAATARSSFSAAHAVEEKLTHDQPDYAQAWSLLGQTDAALGRKEEAVREGRHACELLPLSKDAGAGARLITSLAVIYAWTGEKDLALEQLAVSAKITNGVTYGELKLDPQWEVLRGDPRFEKIVASLAPK